MSDGEPTARRPRKGWLARHKGLLVLLVAVLAIGSLAAGAILRGAKVNVARATRRALHQRVVATGRVEPPARVSIGCVVGGTAVRVGPEEGDRVKAGDVLIELDSAEAQASLDQALAGVSAAQARLLQLKGTGARVASESLRQAEITVQNDELNLKRVESLFGSSAATQKDLDDARKQAELARSQRESASLQAASSSPGGADVLLAQANLAQSQAMVAQARARLAQLRITAPAPGLILTRQVEPGDIVNPGKPLFVLARDGRTRLVAQPDEKSLAFLKVGQLAMASTDAFPALTFKAVVETLAPSVDASRGTVEVKLDVPDPPAYLRADMTVSVDVEIARTDAIAVATDAVQDAGTPRPWLWLVVEGRAQKRPVTLGLRGEGSTEITSGLSEGDLVITPDGKPLHEGDRLRFEG